MNYHRNSAKWFLWRLQSIICNYTKYKWEYFLHPIQSQRSYYTQLTIPPPNSTQGCNMSIGKNKLEICRSPWYTLLNVQDSKRNNETKNLKALASKFCSWFNHSDTTESIMLFFPLVEDVAKGTQTNKQARE